MTAACSTVPQSGMDPDESYRLYEERREALSGLEGWFLKGRLAVSDQNDGGSGTLNWHQTIAGSKLDFHGALGRGAWSLESDESGAILQMADGRHYSASSLKELLGSQLGWQIPVGDLSWWVRGLEAPGEVEGRSLDKGGELTVLRQSGWVIEFERYREKDGFTLPGKLIARQDDKTVKLAIREWAFDQEDVGN